MSARASSRASGSCTEATSALSRETTARARGTAARARGTAARARAATARARASAVLVAHAVGAEAQRGAAVWRDARLELEFLFSTGRTRCGGAGRRLAERSAVAQAHPGLT